MAGRRTTGLTLVELLATMVIVSILTVSALAVLNRLPRVSARDKRLQDVSVLRDAVRDLVTMDLESATQFKLVEGGGFTLKTGAQLDPGTMERSSRQGEVTYQVGPVAGRSCLLRSQQANMKDERLIELACDSISAISIEDVEGPFEPSDEAQPLPEILIVTIEFADDLRGPLVWAYYRS